MNKKLTAVLDWILIEPYEPDEKTASGLVLADASKSSPCKAKVLSVGPITQVVKIGEDVLYKKWEGVDVNWEGKKLLMVKPKDLRGIYEPVQ